MYFVNPFSMYFFWSAQDRKYNNPMFKRDDFLLYSYKLSIVLPFINFSQKRDIFSNTGNY